jgi:hypothetical protein
LVLAAACTSRNGDDVEPSETTTSAVITGRNLDMLFLIDNSSSMLPAQANLLTNLPGFMDAIKNLPGGAPNLHVAVISSDTGAGDGSIAGCDSRGGNMGIFQYTARGTCTASPLQAGATYLSSAGTTANFTGDISAAFTCIAALGDRGCGFEHQFDSVLRALGADGKPAPAENQGFLRRDALLAIIMVTNEDDCSVPPGVALYDTASNTNLASQLGPPANFRCNEFGHRCNGAKPPREAPNDSVTAMVPQQNCTSAECDGLLVPVAEFVARIKALKAAPDSEIVVAAIAGPSTPYTVTWKAPSTSDTTCGASSCPWPVVAHSCTATDGSFGDPSVRINQWVSAFGANGISSSICETSFAPAMQQVATRIGALLSAGGGTGPAPGPIPTCSTDGGPADAAGAGGAGGGAGGMAGGGAGGAAGGTSGADASADARPKDGGGGWCQVGGAGASGSGVAFVIMAWLAASRRRNRSLRRRPGG